MPVERAAAFVDGFNLYHSIKDLGQPHLKWVNLRKLIERFVPRRSQTLGNVYYFSAYAHWIGSSVKRHYQYVDALSASGVTPIMAKFKSKSRRCPKCKHTWTGHEEKETDVNIAIAMLNGAYRDEFDHCYLLSRDSDLTPVVRMLRIHFPNKGVTVLAPPNRGHSNELLHIDPRPAKAKVKIRHVEACLLPAVVYDAGGNVAARRPPEYAPPQG